MRSVVKQRRKVPHRHVLRGEDVRRQDRDLQARPQHADERRRAEAAETLVGLSS